MLTHMNLLVQEHRYACVCCLYTRTHSRTLYLMAVAKGQSKMSGKHIALAVNAAADR
jgi:hypothetical protein